MNSNGWMSRVHSEDGQKRQKFNTFQVKPYYRVYLESLFVFKSHQDIMPIAAKTFLTEINQPHGPSLQKFNNEKVREVYRLLARKTREVVSPDKIP